MKLHARNLAVIAGAETQEEMEKTTEALEKEGIYKAGRAKEILREIRAKKKY